MKHYFHRGEMGDIIYALAFLATEPEPVKLSICQRGAHPIFDQAELLGPLIRNLPYIAELEIVNEWSGAPCINMRAAIDGGGSGATPNIIRPYWECFGEGREMPVPVPPWLNIPWRGGDYCVVNRTERYRGANFRWGEHLPDGELRFVGTDWEFREFHHYLGWSGFNGAQARLTHHPTANMLEAAHVIAGSRGFFGNASSCLALAQGIGHPRIFTEVGNGTQHTCHGIGSEVILNA